MKPLQIVHAIAILAAILFAYQVAHIVQLNSEAAALKSKIDSYNSWGHFGAAMTKSFFNGLTLGVFEHGDIFAVAEQESDKREELDAEVASLNSRYGDAVTFRNIGLIIFLVSMGCGYLIQRAGKQRNPEVKPAQTAGGESFR